MRLTVTIDCDNAVFEDLPGVEVGRILRELVEEALGVTKDDLIEADGYILRDVNGNAVGQVKFEQD